PEVTRWLPADHPESLAQIRERFTHRKPNSFSQPESPLTTNPANRGPAAFKGENTLRHKPFP
ncbi:hypothetical protein ACWEOG_16475, partial [Amycolatopsis japonica]